MTITDIAVGVLLGKLLYDLVTLMIVLIPKLLAKPKDEEDAT